MRSEGTGPLAKAAGLLAVGAVVAAAWLAGRSAWAAQAGFSLLTLAIVIGMLAGNTVYPRVAVRCHAGMLFCKGPLLRLGIMLYGFRLTLSQVLDVGLASFAADALMLASTFLLTCWLGLRWLKMERQTVLLMGAGSSIWRQRLLMVGNSWSRLWVTSRKITASGGSSSILSSAFAAWIFMLSAGLISTTRRPPRMDDCVSGSKMARTASILICNSLRLPVSFSGCSGCSA